MQGRSNTVTWGSRDLDLINIKRNPYLVDYEEQKRLQRARKERTYRSREAVNGRNRVRSNTVNGRSRIQSNTVNGRNRVQSNTINGRSRELEIYGYRKPPQTAVRRQTVRRTAEWEPDVIPVDRRRNPAVKKRQSSVTAKKRRRIKKLRRRLTIGAWMLCSLMIGCLFLLKQGNISMAEQGESTQKQAETGEESLNLFSGTVQGLPKAEFEKHPEWTEDFLSPNEYSRPGEALPEVRDIFVHYTANAGTSAAQNRSYFEQQKDMHEASVSAHFIIGYNGEIIQCVPLDEIAYAVQTRNYDSVSIECCYKAADGAFTQETYDSLISLLAWLTDVYELDTEHILRHYDCGGKKCPVYYTEHEDAWEQLKMDVQDKL